MPTKTFLLALSALAAATLAAGGAGAQTSWTEVDDNVSVPPFEANADEVDDWDVYSSENTKIGEVEEVIGTDASTPTALVIEFDDDAGYGDRDDVIVPLDAFAWDGERLVLSLEPTAIDDLEIYDD